MLARIDMEWAGEWLLRAINAPLFSAQEGGHCPRTQSGHRKKA